jgi:hypothetical protein
MRRRNPLWAVFFLLLSSLPLVSCGSDDAAKSEAAQTEEKAAEHKEAKFASVVTPICPQVAIVRGLDVVRDYSDDSPTPPNLVSAAKLLNISGDCEYRDEGIDVAFEANIIAERGPRLGGLRTGFPFFVAVVDPAGNVLNKNQMTAEINFSSGDPLANHAERLHVFIPLPKDKHSAGPYYKVLSGFQLTPEQAKQAAATAAP